MSYQDIEFYRAKLKRIGFWIGLRYMRNRGVTFEQAYYIVFGKFPRFV